MNSLGREWQNFLLSTHAKFLLQVTYQLEVVTDNTDASINVFAARLSKILVAVYFYTAHTWQILRVTQSALFTSARGCSSLIWYILFSKITAHTNTLIQRMRTLTTSILSLSKKSDNDFHASKISFQHLHYILFLKRA